MVAGRAGAGRSHVFGAYRHHQRMIRKDDWKLIRYNVNGRERTQLFDLQRDPLEREDLAGRPETATREAALAEALRLEMAALDDPCDMTQANWGWKP